MLEDSKRKQVTLVCFILANIIFASLLIYIDSYSVYTWNYETDVGPATMFMQSEEPLPSEDALMNIQGVQKAAIMTKSWCSMVAFPPDQNASIAAEQGFVLAQGANQDNINITVGAVENNPDLFADFPTIFNITDGRMPVRDTECALAQWLIDIFDVDIGAIVTYESGFVHEYHFFRVVGIYDHPEDSNRNYAYYNLGDIVVMPEFVSERERVYYAYIQVEDLILNPIQAGVTLGKLSDLEEQIRNLDPQYALFHHTTFSLDDIQSRGIQRYLEKAAATKTSQLIRSQIALFIGIILSASTIRFNTKKQENRIQYLFARGASTRQIRISVIREVIVLSLVGMAIAAGFGIVISRIGLLAEGFFVFGNQLLVEMPIFLAPESILILGAYAIMLPFITYGGIVLSSRKDDSEDMEKGRLARFVGVLRFLRWDAAVVLVSFGLLLGVWEVGNDIARTPLFSTIIYILPVILTIGLASLISKGTRFGSYHLSRGMSKILPKTGAEIGSRRVGRDRKGAGFAILVFALVTGLLWSNLVVTATLPNTAQSHARFALGGDIALWLDTDYPEDFAEVQYNLSSIPGVEATTMVNVYSYSLSSSLQDTVDIAAIDTQEIGFVAYDERGIPLNESYLSEIVTILDENPAGAVITSDLAETYQLTEGDLLRAFKSNGTEVIALTFNLLKIVDCLPDTMVTGRGYDPPQVGGGDVTVGKGRVWVSKNYEHTLFEDEYVNSVFLCARISDQVSGGAIINSLFSLNPGDVIVGYASASEYTGSLFVESDYIFNSAIDTMLIVSIVIALPSVYLTYLYTGQESRKRDDAILRVLGSTSKDLNLAHQVEMFVLTLYGVLLLLMCIPMFVQNSFLILTLTSSTAYSAYPIPILTVIPLVPIVTFVCGTIIVIGILTYINSIAEERKSLANDISDINNEVNNFERRV